MVTSPSGHSAGDLALRKEASTMALYVAVCLLGALIATPGESADPHVIRLVWGVTIGLAAAHWFAFRLATHLFARGKVAVGDLQAGAAQLLAAAAVAAVTTVPVILMPTSIQLDVVEGLLAAVGYVAARSRGGSPFRALVYGLLALVIAVVIAIVKNRLAGH